MPEQLLYIFLHLFEVAPKTPMGVINFHFLAFIYSVDRSAYQLFVLQLSKIHFKPKCREGMFWKTIKMLLTFVSELKFLKLILQQFS